MRERLFRVIHKLEEMDWSPNSVLLQSLRRIAENEQDYVIEELLEAFRV